MVLVTTGQVPFSSTHKSIQFQAFGNQGWDSPSSTTFTVFYSNRVFNCKSASQRSRPGKSLYRGRGPTACAVVNPLKKWLFVHIEYFVLFLKQPSPLLIDDCTCGTIPFPLYREFPDPAYLCLDGFIIFFSWNFLLECWLRGSPHGVDSCLIIYIYIFLKIFFQWSWLGKVS
jgi:hypothetical protein